MKSICNEKGVASNSSSLFYQKLFDGVTWHELKCENKLKDLFKKYIFEENFFEGSFIDPSA